MQSLFHNKKVFAILVACGFVLSLGISQALAQSDATADKIVVQGIDQMMAGKQLLMNALQKQMLDKDPKLQNGIKLLNDGEQLAMTGKNLMKEKAESGKIKGKEEIMSGTSQMMQGKDEIMKELKSRGMLQEGNLKESETDLKNGELRMMDGKNRMMDGFNNIDWD